MHSYFEMLRYKRPAYSKTEREFCKRFLEPVFGKPDAHGNYILKVGDNPDIAFMSHYDTVHTEGGTQKVWVAGECVMSDSNCLGADCTTGVYIMLNMIEADVEGYYVVHAAEEEGCIGSSALVKDNPSWLLNVQYAISFDRYGYSSVVTHQMGMRTCSDLFAKSFADATGLLMQADDGGVYTDSNEYANIIPECTNISVGYFKQHTAYEYQDLEFLDKIIDHLVNADWSKLVVDRDPSLSDNSRFSWKDCDDEDIYDFVKQHPQFITDTLIAYGFTLDVLEEEFWELNRSYMGGVH